MFKAENLVFGKFKKEDFPLYFQLTGNDRVMKMISGKAFSEEEAHKRFENVLIVNSQHEELGYYIVCRIEDDKFIGLAKIVLLENKKAEIGYSLLPEYWGKGYGSKISKTLVDKARQFDFIEKLVAIIDPENMASKKILEKSQFKLEKACEMEGMPAEIYKLKIT